MVSKPFVIQNASLLARIKFLPPSQDGIKASLPAVFRGMLLYNGKNASCNIALSEGEAANPGGLYECFIQLPAPEFVLDELHVGQKVGLYLGFGRAPHNNADGVILRIMSPA
jgi:hypothetical protein